MELNANNYCRLKMFFFLDYNLDRMSQASQLIELIQLYCIFQINPLLLSLKGTFYFVFFFVFGQVTKLYIQPHTQKKKKKKKTQKATESSTMP